MAEETLIVKIEIDQAVVNASKQRATELARELITLKKEQEALKKATAGNSSAQKAAAGTFIELQAKIAAATKEQRQHTEILKQAKVATQAQEGSNNKLRAQLSLLTANYNALSKAERTETQTGKEMEAQIRALSDELKANESAVGDNRRNVGNYGDALKNLKKELKELQGALASGDLTGDEFQEAAEKAGKLKDQIKDAQEASSELATDSKLGQLKNQLGGVGDSIADLDFEEAAEKAGRLQAVASKLTFGEMIGGLKNLGSALVSMGRALLTNPLFIFAAVIAAVGVGLKMLIDRNEEAAKSQSDYNKAIDGTIILDESLRNSYNKSVIEIRKMEVEYDRLTGKLTDFQAKMKNVELDYSLALKNINDETEKKLAENSGFWQSFKLIMLGQTELFAKESLEIMKSGDQQKKLLDEKTALERKTIEEERLQDINELHKEAQRELTALENEIIKDDFERQKLKIQTDAKFAKEDVDLKYKDVELTAQVVDDKNSLIFAIEQKAAADIEALQKEHNDKIAEANKKAAEDEMAALMTIQANKEALMQQQLAAEAEQAAIIKKFIDDRLSEYDRERNSIQAKVDDLRFAGVAEVDIEQFIADEKKRIRLKEAEDRFKAAETAINAEAELAKNRATAEIEDATIRAATLLQIEQDRLTAQAQLYDANFQAATAGLEGFVIFDEETKAFLLEKETAYQAQLAELNRNTEEKKREEIKKTTDFEIQSAQAGLNVLSNIAGDLGSLAEEGSEAAKDAAIAQGIINSFAAAIAAYQSAASIPVAGFVLGPIAAAAALAAGLANVAKIKQVKAAKGTFLKDGQGTETSDSIPALLSRNETVINAKSSKAFLPLLSKINEWGGGVAFARGGHASDNLVNAFAGGGVATITNQAFQQSEQAGQIADTINTMVPVLVIEEFQAVQGRQVRTATNLEV